MDRWRFIPCRGFLLYAGFAIGTFMIWAGASTVAQSADVETSDGPRYRFYIGAGASVVHHTGYVPGTSLSAEEWVQGGKAFAGVDITPIFSTEVGYYALGEALIRRTAFEERSHAAAISVLINHRFADNPLGTNLGARLAKPLSGTTVFARGGAAYKWISQDTATGSLSEDGWTYLIGFGLEQEIHHGFSLRLEYEYIAKIGTGTIVNIQHTPVSINLLKRF